MRVLRRSRISPRPYVPLVPSYDGPGVEIQAPAPRGYRRVDVRERIGQGDEDFERAAARLMGWGMHRGAGLDVVATEPIATSGVTVVTCLPVGPFGVLAPCRVVRTTATETTRGFTYRTLPDHPEVGEESFAVSRDAAGDVWLTIAAISRPAGLLPRLGRPVAERLQDLITRRYVVALQSRSVRC